MKKIFIIIAILIGLPVIGWKVAYPTTSYRYRMTVVVDTPEGKKTGSSVIEVTTYRYPKWVTLGHTDHETHFKGEAVAVDLGKRGVLFTLLQGSMGADYPEKIIPKMFGRIPFGNIWADLPKELMPTMVTFKDINDPMSVQLAYESKLDSQASNPVTGDHYDIMDNIAILFGKGVKIDRITVEITDDEVTTEMLRWLPWLPQYHGKRFDKDRFGYAFAKDRLANSLSIGSFAAHTIKENKK